MEWVEKDLSAVMAPGKYENWEAYYRAVGKGVLDALAFAHTRSTAHRDVKPSNVLVTDEGREALRLRHFQDSQLPGAWGDAGQLLVGTVLAARTGRRQLQLQPRCFRVCGMSVAALTGRAPSKYEELFALLEEAPLEEPIRRVLRRCLELNQPDLRPANAVLLAGRAGARCARAGIAGSSAGPGGADEQGS
jgi:hypothetical protein